MAAEVNSHAVGMPQLDFSTFPNQIFWLSVFCIVLFALVKIFIIPRMEDIFANRRKVIDGNIAKADELKHRVEEIEKQISKEVSDAKAQCDEILKGSKEIIKDQVNAAMNDSKVATSELIEEAEKRFKDLRNNSQEAIRKISDELVPEIVKKVTSNK
jgi:F-type H+-transporting ATPase subunit b